MSTRQQEATGRAEQIRLHLQQSGVLYAKAILEHDWQTLGYQSVAQWSRCEFGPDRFSAERRQEIVALLTDAGLTQRAIADAVLASQPTVMRDQRARETNESPEPGPEPSVPAASAHSANGSARQQAARAREARRAAQTSDGGTAAQTPSGRPAQNRNGSNARASNGRTTAQDRERIRLTSAIAAQVAQRIAEIIDPVGGDIGEQLAYLTENPDAIEPQIRHRLAGALATLSRTSATHHARILGIQTASQEAI